MELRELANNEASAFIERLIAAAEARATKARAEAEEQVAAMRAEVETSRSALEGESARAAALEADLDSVIEAHRQVDGERLAAESARAQEAAARTKVEDELRGVRELLNRARAEASRLSEALEDEGAQKAIIQEEVEGVRLALSGLERSYEAAEKKISTLETRVSDFEELESALRAALSEAAARASTVEAETAAAAQSMRDRYDAEIRTTRADMDALVVERNAARADLDMIRTEADNLRRDVAAIRETAEAHRAQAQALESERDTLRSEATSLKKDSDARRAETERLEREAAALKTDATALRADVDKWRATAETVRADADRFRGEAERLRGDAETLRASADAQRADADSRRTQEQTLRAEVELARDEAQILRSETEKLRAEVERLRTEGETLRTSTSGASDEITTLQEMLDASREHHERQVAAARELEAQLQQAQGRLHHAESTATSTLASAIQAIEALASPTSISGLFATVVKQLSTELPRVAIFRVKGTHLEGEHAAGFEESVSMKKIVIPMNLDSVITRAAQGGVMVRAEGAELAASRPPVGGAPASAIAVPIMLHGETLAVLYADSEAPTTVAHATFALLVVRHTSVLLSRLTQELKVLKELREYAMLLLQEAEQMFVADVDGGRPAHESIRRLRDTVDCGRQLFAQRAALEGTEAAGLFDEQISILINARASAFAEALEAATDSQKRAAS